VLELVSALHPLGNKHGFHLLYERTRGVGCWSRTVANYNLNLYCHAITRNLLLLT
jgi:hypothetical protein